MREIKFRAWDIEKNRMVYDFETIPYFDSRVITKYNADICMQFTWLKDKNGKDIFEGDIVDFEDAWEEGYEYKEGYEFTNRATVEFLNWAFILTNFRESDNSYYYGEQNHYSEMLDAFAKSNVIWNIYENPELITK